MYLTMKIPHLGDGDYIVVYLREWEYKKLPKEIQTECLASRHLQGEEYRIIKDSVPVLVQYRTFVNYDESGQGLGYGEQFRLLGTEEWCFSHIGDPDGYYHCVLIDEEKEEIHCQAEEMYYQ